MKRRSTAPNIFQVRANPVHRGTDHGEPYHEIAIPATSGKSAAPLALLYTHVTGGSPVIISVISLFAVTNGALIQVVVSAGALYGMRKASWLPAALGAVNPFIRMPLLATAPVTSTILVLASGLPLQTLARRTGSIVLVVFSFIKLSLLCTKRRDPRPEGVCIVPTRIPCCGFLASTALVFHHDRAGWLDARVSPRIGRVFTKGDLIKW